MASFVDCSVYTLIALENLVFDLLMMEPCSFTLTAVLNYYQILSGRNAEIFNRVVITIFAGTRMGLWPLELALDNVYSSIVQCTHFQVFEFEIESLNIVDIRKLNISHSIMNNHFVQFVLF